MNTNFTNLSSGVTDVSYRAFAWGIIGTLITGTSQGMQYIAPQNVTVKKIWAKTSSGTATIKLLKDGTEITDAVNHFAVTSTAGSTVTFNATVITAGQVLTMDISVASGTDIFVVMETQVTTIA